MITKVSEDGYEYRVLQTPDTLTIPNVQYSSSIESGDGYFFHHFFVRCSTLRALGLPLDANPREPTRARVVSEMASTLRDYPAKFHHWNNGITVICDQLTKSDHSVILKFEEGSGICNGGHTYFSIVTYPGEIDDSAYVHIEVIDLPDTLQGESRKHAINDIAKNRNANRQLLPTTQADYLGYYAPFKIALGTKSRRVIWHEGDSIATPDAISSELLIRMLATLDPLWFSHPINSPSGKSTHKIAATGSKSIHSKWFDGQDDPEVNLRHMAPLAVDAFWLNELVGHSLKHDDLSAVSPRWRRTSFYQWLSEKETHTLDYKMGELALQLPNPAMIMFLGFFRSSIWLAHDEQGRPKYIGYLANPEELWNEGKVDLLKRLTTAFDDSNQDPNQFIKNNAPYENQLISLVYGQRAPRYPVRFFEIETGAGFVSDSENPTHILTSDGDAGATLGAFRQGDKVPREQLFRKVENE